MSANHAARRLLIVEDEEFVLQALTLLLEAEGYTVAGAANGQEALVRLQTRPLPDLILLDLSMPLMDARAFRHRQEQDAALASIPFVLLSGDDRIRANAASMGAADYLPKPVEMRRLLRVIERHCPRPPR